MIIVIVQYDLLRSTVTNYDQEYQVWRLVNGLVYIKEELVNLGQVYQVIACMALWDKIGQIKPKV